MTHLQRALKTFKFEHTDRPAFDLMENAVWHELYEFFLIEYGLKSQVEILNFLDCDFRWAMAAIRDQEDDPKKANYSDHIGHRTLSNVSTVSELDKLFCPDPNDRILPDFAKIKTEYPEHALVFCPSWMPAFSSACDNFGMINALCKMAVEPEIIEAYVIKLTEFAVEVLKKGIAKGARKYCDFYWMGDDFATETSLMISPEMWRKLIKPAIKKQVRIARDAGFHVLFHSCGAVEDVYPDFIEMGISAHCGVQTSAKNMNIEHLAKKYGGEIVIYGGVDAQTTLVQCNEAEVFQQVRRNIAAFEKCGGYVVSNSHHGLSDIKGSSIVSMAQASRFPVL